MKIGCIEHVIAQMADEKPLGEITMKWLCQKLIASYFIHILAFCLQNYNKKYKLTGIWQEKLKFPQEIQFF